MLKKLSKVMMAGIAGLMLMNGPASEAQVITLSVSKATIHFRNPPNGDVRWTADFVAVLPAADDLVAVHVDGILMFAQPFGSFTAEDAKYVFNVKGNKLQLDFAAMELKVFRRDFRLDSLDSANGVDIEPSLGDETAIENITMEARAGNRLVYTR